MNPLIYNISMLLGLACIAVGAALVWSLGMSLMVTGGLLILLTLVSLKVIS
jgi:hypothetical protein